MTQTGLHRDPRFSICFFNWIPTLIFYRYTCHLHGRQHRITPPIGVSVPLITFTKSRLTYNQVIMKRSIPIVLSFFIASIGATTVDAAYGFSQITACEGDVVRVTWENWHNIQETTAAECGSSPVGSPIVGYHLTDHIQEFSDLHAFPGTTRYFKCDTHCGTSSSCFEVSCPPSLADWCPCKKQNRTVKSFFLLRLTKENQH